MALKPIALDHLHQIVVNIVYHTRVIAGIAKIRVVIFIGIVGGCYKLVMIFAMLYRTDGGV